MKLHRQASVCLLLLGIWFGAASVAAQAGWKDKPYTQWTKEEIVALISDSPWAQVRQPTLASGDRSSISGLSAVTLRLRSSLQIRQALVRLKQIEAKYDKMAEKDRAAFDAKMKGTLDCPACADNYVITLGPPISSNKNHEPLASGVIALRNATLALLEKNVYLTNEKGEKRALVHFVPPKHEDDEATLFFSRFDAQGQPLISPDTKKIIVILDVGQLPGSGGREIARQFEFDVAKLLNEDKVDF